MRLFVGIAAHDTDEYGIEAQIVAKRYMRSHPDIESYFMKSRGGTEILTAWEHYTEQSDPDTLYRSALLKLKNFMRFALCRPGWDFLLISTLASFWHWPRVMKMLEDNSDRHVITSIVDHGDGMPFPTGCGYFLSHEAVCSILVVLDSMPFPIDAYANDVVLGMALRAAGYSTETWLNYKYLMVNLTTTYKEIDEYFHYRCRLDWDKVVSDTTFRVEHEIPMTKRLVEYLYPGQNNL